MGGDDVSDFVRDVVYTSVVAFDAEVAKPLATRDPRIRTDSTQQRAIMTRIRAGEDFVPFPDGYPLLGAGMVRVKGAALRAAEDRAATAVGEGARLR